MGAGGRKDAAGKAGMGGKMRRPDGKGKMTKEGWDKK